MSKQKLRLPRDLRGHVCRAVCKKVMLFALLMIAFGSVLYLWGERIFEMLPPIARIGAYLLTMLIPFAITRFPFCLFDSTFTGAVKGVRVKNEYVMEKKGIVLKILHLT